MKLRPSLAVLLLFLAAAAVTSAAQQAQDPAVRPVCVIFVRHAETAASTETNRDPALSEIGGKRVAALARMLGSSGVTQLYASEYPRTQQTLAPLAAKTGLEVEVISARDATAQLDALRQLAPGSVAVVAGHSNTIPALVSGLGEPAQGLVDGSLAHDSYDRMFLVVVPGVDGAEARTLELGYGR